MRVDAPLVFDEVLSLVDFPDIVVICADSSKEGIRADFSARRFRKVCHGDLGFRFQAGSNGINMLKIIDGEYCGACHDGGVAWSIENCDLCHSGSPNTPTQVHHSTVQKLVAPPKPASDASAEGGQ